MFAIILYAERASNHIENVNIKVVNNEKDAIKELIQDPNYYNDITTILLEMENESINTDINNKVEQLCNIYRRDGLDELDEDDPKTESFIKEYENSIIEIFTEFCNIAFIKIQPLNLPIEAKSARMKK